MSGVYYSPAMIAQLEAEARQNGVSAGAAGDANYGLPYGPTDPISGNQTWGTNVNPANINALIQLTHGILPRMLKRKRGKIINHSSVVSLMNFPCASTYAASKAAVLAFTNCLRTELQGTGVSTLVLITPGVDTRMFKDIPKLYGTNLDLGFLKGIAPKKYAQMIREAILEDLSQLKPHGITGVGLLLAQHLPKTFENVVLKRFKR